MLTKNCLFFENTKNLTQLQIDINYFNFNKIQLTVKKLAQMMPIFPLSSSVAPYAVIVSA